MTPYGIENRLKLRNPIYSETSIYGHMGRKSEKKTKKNKKLQINLALNYGSKNELINAFKNLQKNRE